MFTSLIRLLAAVLVLIPVGAFAAPPVIELQKTGQTLCYDASGAEITCTGTGQDGEKQTGLAWPAPRFTNNGDGTITDHLTDLVWLQNADCYNGIGWQAALDNAALLANGACSLGDGSTAGDWRLPNRVEFLSLVNYQQSDGAIWLDSQGFLNAVHGWYWTSDTYVTRPAEKWVVHTVGDALTNVTAPDAPTFHALFVRNLTGPIADVTPASADFGQVGVNAPSAPQTFTIANSGKTSLTVSGITVTGTDAAMFAVNPATGASGACGSLTPTIAAGANCTIAVVFTPASVGAKTAALRVASNSLTTPSIDRSLTGTGIEGGFDVTASVPGGNGTISSTNPLHVASGATASFTLAPAAGFRPAATVSGTCPAGSLNGNTYTTGAITTSCTVVFSFVPQASFNIGTVTSGNGSIVCTPGTTVEANTPVSCTVTPAQGNSIAAVTIDGATQSVTDATTFTHSFGPVTADHVVSATFAVIGVSGAETIADAIKVFQAVMGRVQLTDQEKSRYDVAPLGSDGKPNPDGIIDVGDVVILLRKIAGVITW